MRLKSLIFIVLIALCVNAGYAQKKKKPVKPSLGKVEGLINKSKSGDVTAEEILKAKEIIDLATEYEKTKGKTKTWYLKGELYKLIYSQEAELEGITKSEALSNAVQGYNKAVEIGNDNDSYTIFSGTGIDGLWSELINAGVKNYNEGNNTEAAKYFEYVGLVKPNDTTGHLYAAAAAQESGDYQRAIDNYKKLVKVNPQEKYYVTMLLLQKESLKDVDAAIATINEAKSVLGEGNTNEINKYEIDILIKNDQIDQAIAKLDQAIEKEPDNVKLYVRQGLLYDGIANDELKKEDDADDAKVEKYQDLAEKAYQKALEIDENDLTANFNYAVIVSNKANQYFREYNLMTPSEELKRGAQVIKQGKDILTKAIPYMEKARELKPEDQDVLYALQSFYSRLNDKEKIKEINDRLTELGYEN